MQFDLRNLLEWKLNDQRNRSASPVLISLGSNINPKINIKKASALLSEKVEGVRFSSVWESPAVGSSGPNYLNSAALMFSALSLEEIKSSLITPIENQLGRFRTADKYRDRTIDIDVLIYDDRVVDPEVWTQAHLAIPASELIPDFKNSETGGTLLEFAQSLEKRVEIRKRNDIE